MSLRQPPPPPRIVPQAPGDTFTLAPSPTPGFSDQLAECRPIPGPPGFQPRSGEGNAAARTRVIDTVTGIASGNGQSPARNG